MIAQSSLTLKGCFFPPGCTRAIIKSQQSFWYRSAEDYALPAITFGARNTYGDLVRNMGVSVIKVLEIYIQAFIYGHLDNFFDEDEAFGYVHEFAHRYAGIIFHSGSVLYELAEQAHRTLYMLGSERLSSYEIANLWAHFWQTDNQIRNLVQKFRPIEEIVATYLGLRFSPPEVRNTVEARIEEKLKEENWYAAYKVFADSCESFGQPLVAAIYIFEPVYRMIEKVDMDGAELLYIHLKIQKTLLPYIKTIRQKYDLNEDKFENFREKIESAIEQEGIPDEVLEELESLAEQEGIPDEVFDSAFEEMFNIVHPNIMRQGKTIINGEEQMLRMLPVVRLLGRPSRHIIMPDITYSDSQHKHEWDDFVTGKIFFESLRQQLSKRCGIVCPFCSADKTYPCRYKEALQRIYERLPEEYKKYFDRPE